jgi:hypothetical protein
LKGWCHEMIFLRILKINFIIRLNKAAYLSVSMLKGWCHERIIFLRALKIKAVFIVWAQMVFPFFVEKIKNKFLFASMKSHTLILNILPVGSNPLQET